MNRARDVWCRIKSKLATGSLGSHTSHRSSMKHPVMSVISIALLSTWSGSNGKISGHQGRVEPHVREVGATVLHETDSVFVGRPFGITLSPRGDLFVSDGANWTVLQFDGAGRFVRSFGKRGRGPGEFTSPGPLTITGDTLVVFGGIKLQAFGVKTGELLWERPNDTAKGT